MIRVNLLSVLFYVLIFTKFSFAQFGWTPLNSGTVNNINSVFFVNNNTGYVSGDQSTILKTTNSGNNWIVSNSPVSANFSSIFFVNPNTGYTVGDIGRILKTTNGGINWNIINAGINKNFYSVYFLQETGWVIGEDGIILKTTNAGNSWNLQTSGTNFILKSLYFLNAQTGYIAGAKNTGYPALILKTVNGGENWSVQLYPSFSGFSKIFFESQQNGFVTGSENGTNGMIGATTNSGNNWTFPVQNISYPLNGLHFFSSSLGFAVGNNGVVITTSNGGSNWSYESSGTVFNLNNITYSGTALFAVGNNGTVIKKNYGWLRARLDNIYKPDCGRVSNEVIQLSDSLCSGTIDSVFWYINNQLKGNQHTVSYGFPQGTTFIKLIIKNNQGYSDSAFATVTRSVYKISTAGPIIGGSSLIGDSVLYTISTGNAVHRMDINGNILYSLSVGGDILSSCSIGYDTSIFVTSTNNNLYGFSRYGAPLWPALPLGASAVCTPTVDSVANMLYVGVTNNNFFAINKTSGTVAWSTFADAPVRTSAIISNERKLFFVSSRGTLYGFNLSEMSNPPVPYWTLQLNDSVLVSPAVDRCGDIFVGSRGGKLYKIGVNGNAAEIIWQADLGSPVTTSITIDADNNVYAGTAGSKLFCVNSGNGTVKWFYTSKGSINSTPAISYSQTVFFGNDAGEVIGLDSEKNLKFYYLDSAKISCPFLCQMGTLYIGSVTGKVLAFYDSVETLSYTGIRGGGKSVPVWGVFQNNPRRTGIQDSNCRITGVNNVITLPGKFELKQNYPNPFNPDTKIGFVIGRTVNVRIKIYDITGRQIEILINKKMEKGNYELTWHAVNMPSGVYFYKIEAGEFSETRKMIVLK